MDNRTDTLIPLCLRGLIYRLVARGIKITPAQKSVTGEARRPPSGGESKYGIVWSSSDMEVNV